VDRAEQVGVDHPSDLLVGGFLDGGEDAVAGVVDDHVDRVERREGVGHDPVHLLDVGDVEPGDPQAVAVLGAQIVQRLGSAQCRGDAVAADQQAFGQLASEAGRGAGDEPGGRHGVPSSVSSSTLRARVDSRSSHRVDSPKVRA
jgi:hypothetical protein